MGSPGNGANYAARRCLESSRIVFNQTDILTMRAQIPKPGSDPWLDAVLSQVRTPDWLTGDAPHGDLVVSTRARVLRNLSGFKFPRKCSERDLRAVEAAAAPVLSDLGFQKIELASEAERAMLVGSRLVSPDFLWGYPGRSVFLDAGRSSSIMVNEEDHLRIQAVAGGLGIPSASGTASDVAEAVEDRLPIAWSREFGYLASDSRNAGAARRVGVLMHLPCLTLFGGSSGILEACAQAQCEVRGLFGEGTAGIGAFVQVSTISPKLGNLSSLVGHLIDSERAARRKAKAAFLEAELEKSISTIRQSDGINIEDAVRALSWLRLGACMGLAEGHPRELDSILALIVIRETDDPAIARRRAGLLRHYFG